MDETKNEIRHPTYLSHISTNMVSATPNQGRRNGKSYDGYANTIQRLNKQNWGILFLHLTFSPTPILRPPVKTGGRQFEAQMLSHKWECDRPEWENI